MGDLVPEYKGMKSIEARENIVQKLKDMGALVSIEEYSHNVGTCYRCHGIVEPRISEQWFVAMKELARPAIEAVKNGNIKFVPKKYEKTYFNWLENIQDWCISRQLWWGHRIPAYYCNDCNHITVSKENPKKCEKCGSTNIYQDPDTLDTWFSSALWPFSTMGWPDKNAEDYKTFYPTDALITGYDIIFFWVVRMVFSAYYATNEEPFSDVVIHGLVRDSQGRKMSKSLGNGIDPLEIVNKYGSDALRFSLLSGTTMGNDIKYMPEKLEQASNFANKIWNAAKFVTMNASTDDEIIAFRNKLLESKDYSALRVEDKWMMGKIDTLIDEITNNINNYDLGIAVDKLYSFIWDEFCDWYIEMVKARLNSNDNKEKIIVSYVLDYALRTFMKLLHPFMPFITSEIYSYLVKYDDKELMLSTWPEKMKIESSKDIEFIETIKSIIMQVRNIRTNMNVHPSKKVELIFVINKNDNEFESYKKMIVDSEAFINKLAFGSVVKVQDNMSGIESNAIAIAGEGINLYMPFNELVDIEEEKTRLNNEKNKMEAEVKRSQGILTNQGFLAKAPEEKVNEEKAKLEKYTQMLKEINDRLMTL